MMRTEIGDTAPFFEVTDVSGQLQTTTGDRRRYTLLTFFRHAGCPMCNLRTRELILAAKELELRNVRVLAVFESSSRSIERDVGRQSPPFPIIPDPERNLYKLYGVAVSWSGFFKIFYTRPKHVFEAIFKNGFIPKFAEATPMMPAEILIDPDGQVVHTYYGRDIGDHMPLSDFFALLDSGFSIDLMTGGVEQKVSGR